MNRGRDAGGGGTKERTSVLLADVVRVEHRHSPSYLSLVEPRITGAATLSQTGGPSWYLIHCKPRQDERALENLERQAFQCYRPMRYRERLRDGRIVTASEPLFPGYLFIRLDSVNDNWYPIRFTRGVHRIVRFNQHPLPVRHEIIEEIRERLCHTVARESYLKPGERVRITEGAFAQLEAIFVDVDGEERVILLLNILQTDQKLTFPIQSVCKLG